MNPLKTGLAATTLALASITLSVQATEAQTHAPPGGDFQKVSELVELPEFIPGLGVLWVDPGTLPAGPFLAYDRDGELVSTVYMVPLDDLNERKAFTDLEVGDRPVRSVDFQFNAGHPGIPEPHYHVILWHAPSDRVAGAP